VLVLDTELQDQWRKTAAREDAAALRQKSLADDIKSNTISVDPDNGREVSDLLAQMGRPLSSQEVQRRINLINPRIIFERCIRYPELTGVYIEVEERNPAGGFTKRKMHLFGMESGMMPEFSVLHKTKKNIANPDLFGNKTPTREVDWLKVDTFASETRGWRTVLIRLLKARLINRIDVERFFGWSPSQESEKWSTNTSGG